MGLFRSFFTLALIVVTSPLSLQAASEEQEYNESWQLFQAGNTAEAIKGFTKYLGRHPRGQFLPEAHFTLARIEPSGNNAFIHYQFIVDNYPGHELASQSSFATAQYYQSLGAMPEASARFLATYSRYPATAAGSESLYRLALLAVAADSMESADRDAQAFIDNYPQQARAPSLLSALADHWQTAGDTARANPRWRDILTRYPQSGEAGNAREQLLANSEEEPSAGDSAEIPGKRLAKGSPAAGRGRPAIAAGARNEPPSKGYYIQVGAYTNRDMLLSWVSTLAAKGYACFVDSANGPGKKTYRLQVGPYADRASVQADVKKLRASQRINGIIVQK